MEDFFSTVFYYTNGFYSQLLDTYLYKTTPGYLHIGLFTVIISLLVCFVFYYLFKPVRRQTIWWFGYYGIAAFLNFCFSIWYTTTPLINNEIANGEDWTYMDCTMFGITDIIWTLIFYTIFSFIIKRGSPAKYVPFQKF